MNSQAILLLALATALTLPLAANAQIPAHVGSHPAAGAAQTKKQPALMYACSICHHQVTAAQAKTLHFVCPVDHGKLIPVKNTLPSRPK